MQPDFIRKDRVLEQVSAVRRNVGLWLRASAPEGHDAHGLVRIVGPDAASWLQTQTTNDVLALESGQGQAGALLDRKGRLQAYFTLHRWEQDYWLLVEKAQLGTLLEQLDAHRFLEAVEIADVSQELEQIVVQGPRSLPFLASLFPSYEGALQLPREWYSSRPVRLLGFQVLAFRLSVTGEDGFVLVVERGQGTPFFDALLEEGRVHGAAVVDTDALDILRIEAGMPRWGKDVDATTRISETPLESVAVSYEKGCYLGQEVVAKLKHRGALKRALMGLAFEKQEVELPIRDSPLWVDRKRGGTIKSGAFSPTLGKPIALAYLEREHWKPGDLLELRTSPDGAAFLAQVVQLPFYRAISREERARCLYEDALARFEADPADADRMPIDLLQEAVLFDPALEDAHEALGVILHRQGRTHEAIEAMQRLARLNPGSPMAHTNLSVFYAAKGMLREAEEEKAQATLLEMGHARAAKKAEELAAAERERIRREALDRIPLFEEVLAMDPDDPVATYGLGTAYMHLGEYAKAIPHLERAARAKENYSAAYLNLGKCREFLGQVAEACSAYRAGIEAARRQGDLTPLREMERRLNALESSHGPAEKKKKA